MVRVRLGSELGLGQVWVRVVNMFGVMVRGVARGKCRKEGRKELVYSI